MNAAPAVGLTVRLDTPLTWVNHRSVSSGASFIQQTDRPSKGVRFAWTAATSGASTQRAGAQHCDRHPARQTAGIMSHMYSLGLDDDNAQVHLQRQLAVIDIIEDLNTQLAEPPRLDSEMYALDRTVLPDAPVSLINSMRRGLTASLDSLRPIAAHFKGEGPATLISLQSGIRTALMGASRVVFVLGPDESAVREANARIVLAQEWNSLNRALRDFEKFEVLKAMAPPPGFVADMQERAAPLRGTAKQSETKTLILVAEEIGRQLARRYPDIEERTAKEAVLWIWHSASGSAHGFGWPTLTGGDFVTDFGTVVPASHLAFDAAVRRWASRS